MIVHNWGIPLKSAPAEPGDIVTFSLGNVSSVGLLVEDPDGRSVIVLKGWTSKDEQAPYLIDVDQLDDAPSKIAAEVVIDTSDEAGRFMLPRQPRAQHGNLLSGPGGKFGIAVRWTRGVIGFYFDGTPVARVGDCLAYAGWKMSLKLPGKTEPVSLVTFGDIVAP